MSFSDTPMLVKISLIVSAVGFLFHLIGFSTEYWQSTTVFGLTIHSGLWSYDSNYSLPSWFEATQAFETLGFIAAIASLILIVLYIFVPQTAGKRIIFILGMVACFVAAGCILLGIIIYGSKAGGHLSWSYALCTIAGIIFGVSGILLVIDMLKR